ncbi:hypothetical protein ONZ51_g10034 [Trametes cubensis]|uniref:DUF6533 domain-containing protein n=1 Tax=Trametes cubensis TaxID=1111947 RepID=A0AAD7TK80_9APHY|nr:hypothetical protein ONZ51_g10034 [Trametes cubensis]
MSSGSSDAQEISEIIAFYQSLFVNTCCPIAVLAFLTYEYLITFDREVSLFWRRRLTGASILFSANRYLPLLVNILNLTISARMSDTVRNLLTIVVRQLADYDPQSCNDYVKALQAIEILQYLPWAAFSTLRTFALSRGNWVLAMLVLLLSAVPLGVNFSQYHWLVVYNDPMLGCGKSSTVTLETAKKREFSLTIASRTCLMVADIIVLVVTWMSTLATLRLTDMALKGKPTFARMLLRDGTIYFSILLVLNTLHLTFTMLSITSDALSPVSYFTTFTEPITAVLVSRFLLNLQEVNQYNHRSAPASLTQSITLDFASRVVGSLGSSLESSDDSVRTPEDGAREFGMTWEDNELNELDWNREAGCSRSTHLTEGDL